MDVRDLSGRTVLVTGAASGIGKETALAFARRGASLIVCDLNEAGLAETERQIRSLGRDVFTRRVDVANPEEMRGFAEAVHQRVEAVDILMNNAGVGLGARAQRGERPAGVRCRRGSRRDHPRQRSRRRYHHGRQPLHAARGDHQRRLEQRHHRRRLRCRAERCRYHRLHAGRRHHGRFDATCHHRRPDHRRQRARGHRERQ